MTDSDRQAFEAQWSAYVHDHGLITDFDLAQRFWQAALAYAAEKRSEEEPVAWCTVDYRDGKVVRLYARRFEDSDLPLILRDKEQK